MVWVAETRPQPLLEVLQGFVAQLTASRTVLRLKRSLFRLDRRELAIGSLTLVMGLPKVFA